MTLWGGGGWELQGEPAGCSGFWSLSLSPNQGVKPSKSPPTIGSRFGEVVREQCGGLAAQRELRMDGRAAAGG